MLAGGVRSYKPSCSSGAPKIHWSGRLTGSLRESRQGRTPAPRDSREVPTLFRSNKSAEKKNPFKLRKGTDWNVLKWTPVHPEKAMLDAVRHGNPGLYAFGLSLNQFHTVTIVLKKDAEGPLRPGGGGYELFWNDQNVKKVGALGETIPANDLARRLFNTFNDPDFTDPRVFKTPATMEGHTDPLPLGEWAKRWEDDNLYVGDQDKARRNFLGIRCQTQGVMIWQLFPK